MAVSMASFRSRDNEVTNAPTVIPAEAGMIVRTAYARRPSSVIPAKAGIHGFSDKFLSKAP